MSSMKMKLIEEILNHMDKSQGMDLKGMVDKSKEPLEEALESPEEAALEGDEKPKGLSVEKISILGKPDHKIDEVASNDDAKELEKKGSIGSQINYPGMPKPKSKPTAMNDALGDSDELSEHDEMSDDELKELLNKYMG